MMIQFQIWHLVIKNYNQACKLIFDDKLSSWI